MDVIQAANKIIELKGYTSWAIALMVARLCETILKNQRTVVTVSTLPEGWQGIHEECFISMPAVLGEFGITHVVNTRLSDVEKKKLLESVSVMVKVIESINLDE